MSVTSDGSQANSHSYWGFTSANGRWVVFSSDATNMVPGDFNGKTDVFRLDRATGEEGNDRSFAGSVSKDGRLVSFWSHASNLVPGDGNGQPDVFLTTSRRGRPRASTSASTTASTTCSCTTACAARPCAPASPTATASRGSSATTGANVSFTSRATNLVLNDDNDTGDAFVRDLRRWR